MKYKYNRIPKLHQSDDLVMPCPAIISGEIYSGVPQKDRAFSFPFKCFAIPKSASFRYPSSSINMFSGFKSLYTIP